MRELLLLLCRYPYEDKNREQLFKIIMEISDWLGLVNLINAHGIIALAAYNIKEAGLLKKFLRKQWQSLKMDILRVWCVTYGSQSDGKK